MMDREDQGAGDRPTVRPWLVVATLALAGVVALLTWWWSQSQTSPVDQADTRPLGRWHRPPEPMRRATSIDEQSEAQVLSLPYVTGRFEAEDRKGAIVHLPERVAEGVNLYNSGHGPEAILIDRDGQALHRWRLPWERAFPEIETYHPVEWRRVALLPNGDLIAMFQGAGLVKMDRDSNLIWSTFGPFFNDLWVAPDGSILTLEKRAVDGEIVGRSETESTGIDPTTTDSKAGKPIQVLEDFVTELDASGAVVRRTSILRALQRNRPDLLDPLPDVGDLLHSNTILPVAGGIFSGADNGGLLLSLRNIDSLVVMDPESGEILWGQRGPWKAQHEPVILEGGDFLLFDNKGAADGKTRVLRWNPGSSTLVAEWPGLWSPEAGSVQTLDNGNLLITESERGRALEIAADGTLIWEYISPHRAGKGDELVATLFEVVRISRPEWLGFEEPGLP